MISRRDFLANSAMGALAAASTPLLKAAGPYAPAQFGLQLSQVRRLRQGIDRLEKHLDALHTAGVKRIFIEQDGTATGDELGAVRQAYEYLVKIGWNELSVPIPSISG